MSQVGDGGGDDTKDAGDCARVRPLLSRYLENDLGPEERALVEAEVARCARCRAELDALRVTVGKLGGLRTSAPPRFLEGIQSQIHQRSRGRFFRRRWMLFGRIPFEWVSLVMILAMLAYYVATLQSTPTNVAPTP